MGVGVQSEAGARTTARACVPLPRLLRWFWAGSAAVLALTVAVALIERAMGFSKWHYNPLAGDRYQDLMEFWDGYRQVHSASYFGGTGASHIAYPPLGAAVYAALYATGHPVAVYLTTAWVWLAGCVWGVRRALLRAGIAGVTATLFPLTVVLVSFPIMGLLQRGNIELFVWIAAALGTWAFLREREDWAAVLWGLAAAMKLFPIVLLALLLPRRKWRAFALGVATFAGVTLAVMAWLGPTLAAAARGWMRNVFGYQGVRVSEWTLHELMANHTAFHLAKFAAMIGGLPLAKLTLPYYACGALILALVFFGRLWRMPVANQLLALTAFMTMLPPVSYFYTLVHLYAPCLVLVFVTIEAERDGERVPGLALTLLLFLPLFASFMLFTFPRVWLFGGMVQGALLALLFLCGLQYRFEVTADKG